MICQRCGAVNNGGSRFCEQCGAQLPAGSAAAQPNQPGVTANQVPAPGQNAAWPPAPGQAASGPSAPMPMPDQTMIDHPPLPGTSGTPAPAPGTPSVPAPATNAPYAASGYPTNSTNPTGPSATQPTTQPVPPSYAATVTAVAKRGPNKLVILLSIILVALLVAGTTLFFTYRAEMWGGKVLPDAASIASGVTSKNGKKSVVKAKDITAALKAKGLKVKTVPVFSGEERGAFLGYEGAQAGARVKQGSTVTVQESAGPGVPKDTVGKDVNKVTDTFADMGVPVHYKKVVIAQDSKTPEGQVAVTYPAPGVGLTEDEESDGIYIGVASKGDGIPVDILGQEKSDAVSALEAEGYDVTLKPHYSSEQYVGKISGSYPAPGSELSSGESVTLYYGIDKDSNMDVLSRDNSYNGRMASIQASAMIGMYCKNEVKDASKDCVTLEQSSSTPYGGTTSDDYQYLHIKGEDEDKDHLLGLSNFSQDISGAMLSADQYTDPNKLPMKNHLLLKDWGMFELYAGMDLPNCGTTTMTGSSVGEYCIDGVYKMADFSGGTMTPPAGAEHYSGPTGLTYEMKDFVVYFPVGSDVDSLESSGYFDADELAKANKEEKIDTTRPFILVRDKSLYDSTSDPVDDWAHQVDPFVPTNKSANGYQNEMEPMKPAPSGSTVYYLMEQNGDLDWDSLPDADVKVPASKSGADSSDSSDSSDKSTSKKSAKDMTLQEIRSTVSGGDFTPIAGKYCQKDNSSCITIDDTGKATSSGSKDLYMSPDDHTVSKLQLADADPRWVPEDVGLDLKGPDSDYQCGSYRGSDACYNGDEFFSEAEIFKPFEVAYIPAGTSSSKLEGLAASSYSSSYVAGKAKPDSSKAFLKIIYYHMNEAPLDETVYYLTE
ncbi:PASTA domain-containing protein [Bifidobacterium olomucense]|uniref:PASTA domain-containing protein n=1 Tax=Bifidobacterium olomucense TaxID=2675324 RepID=A0A7Y0EY53_9BIFI|nr:PASTA domain-containing protein [Bifidobacterium sp. DSM 109959]NMM98564.1 PASTA domain-containing protein [Bifidobacterium sp. DSM 109959]